MFTFLLDIFDEIYVNIFLFLLFHFLAIFSLNKVFS